MQEVAGELQMAKVQVNLGANVAQVLESMGARGGSVNVLETVDVDARLEVATEWVKEALAELTLAEKIRDEVSDGMEARQREFLLRQQLAAIRSDEGIDLTKLSELIARM